MSPDVGCRKYLTLPARVPLVLLAQLLDRFEDRCAIYLGKIRDDAVPRHCGQARKLHDPPARRFERELHKAIENGNVVSQICVAFSECNG